MKFLNPVGLFNVFCGLSDLFFVCASNKNEEPRFYINVTNTGSMTLRSHQKTSNSSWKYDIRQTIEMTCVHLHYSKSSEMHWIDNYGFATERIAHYHYSASKLTLRPDRDDDGLEITCKAYGPVKEWNITISLIASVNHDQATEPDTTKYVGVRKNTPLIANFDCLVPVSSVYKNPKERSKQGETKTPFVTILANHTIINNFEEQDNGTTVFSVQYINNDTIVEYNRDTRTYKRLKRRFVHYIKDESDKILKDNQITVGIITGTLSAIIFILLFVIILMWYRKKHKPTRDSNNSSELVYAEMEDRPPMLPPPRQNHPAYATIIGTLVPKPQSSREEQMYM